jgi:MtaA/CmuA family methyltransferase
MITCARDFNIDWVTVMSDPWAEASAFGIRVDYPADNLPVDTGGHPGSAIECAALVPFDPLSHERCRNRIDEIKEFRKRLGDELFIVGWVEGPVAEYVDLRKASEASVDFLIDPENVSRAMDVIVDSAMAFIDLQVDAGAHCIGIGDAFCSQIGPELYGQFAFLRQKKLVDHIHSRNALAKLHICGNTSSILEMMIATGADIVDIDHLVPSMSAYPTLLRKNQVLCGKADPVSVIQDGNPGYIAETAASDYLSAAGRCIISAGCEITPGTSVENMRAFMEAAAALE